MATTFKAMVYRDNKKQDGTYNVKIRVTHNRSNTKVSTKIYVTSADLYKTSLKIKNQHYVDLTDDLIKKWRKIVAGLEAAADEMSLKEIIEYIRTKEKEEEKGKVENDENKPFKLDFIKYGREVAAKKSEGTRRGYLTSLNALERFMNGKVLDVNDITTKFLDDFEEFIKNEPVLNYSPKTQTLKPTKKSKAEGRAVSGYLADVRHIHNVARREHNDDETNRIPNQPFSRYTVKRPPRTKKRAMDVNVIQQIIDLPDFQRTDGSKVDLTRRDLARDCYILSLAFAGMNAADLYDCPAQKFGKKTKIIYYKRKKTRTRRQDEAEMYIRVEPFLYPLLEKYKDPKGKRLFCFYRHYSTPISFNCALSQGLKQVKKIIKPKKDLTFYSARHSWATIGRSAAVKLDKYTIHEGLNHVDDYMRITDIYVDRDFSVIWDANAKILSQFNWKTFIAREKNRQELTVTPDEK